MKKIYIAHPYLGRLSNKNRIADICTTVANMGYLPISPVHALDFLDDSIPAEREKALELCKELIKVCDQVWLFGDWRNSEGCSAEVAAAKGWGIPVLDIAFLISNFGDFKGLL